MQESLQLTAFAPELIAVLQAYSADSNLVAAHHSVIQASSSVEAYSPDSGSPSVTINLTIEGNASDGTVEALRQASTEIVEMVMGALDEREYDAKRRVYR